MKTPAFDLILFGATSFVGRILASYLLDRHRANGSFRWAAAARSEARLSELRASHGARASGLPLVVADASDEVSLRAMCASTRVVVSTVGPYALHGEPLVKVCCETGTDYCDLTGEVQWIRRMIDRYEARARESGARIVHCCGFDSIPSDLGVHFLQREAIRRFGKPCARVKMRVKAMRGGISGGTAASLMNVVEEAARDPALRRELSDPFSLCPSGAARGTRQPSVSFARYDDDFGAWIAPFVMAGINTRVVHRSNALSGYAYGEDFRYDEAVMTGRGVAGGVAAGGIAAGMAGFMLAAALPPSRWALRRFVLPAQGDGPSAQAQSKGFFDLRLFGRTDDGQTLRARVTGDRDPGYGSTAKMLGEAAACLVQDVGRDARPGGFWTPAAALGDRLIERLRAHAGIRFELLEP